MAVVCELAHKHLGKLDSGNDVLRLLPRGFAFDASTAEEVARRVETKTRTVEFRRPALRTIYGKLMKYQEGKRASWVGRTGETRGAKRVACELIKAWLVANRNKEEDTLQEDEVRCYQEFVNHLLHYDDVLKFGTTFRETLVDVHERLQELRPAIATGKHKQLLDHIARSSRQLCDSALRVALLAVTCNHTEVQAAFEDVSVEALAKPGRRNESRFWGTDYGLVLDAALTRGAPDRFPAVGCGADVWLLWTHERDCFKIYEYGERGKAEQGAKSTRCYFHLVGPEGKLRDGGYGVSPWLKRELGARVDLQLALHRAALGLPPAADAAPPTATPRGSAAPPAATLAAAVPSGDPAPACASSAGGSSPSKARATFALDLNGRTDSRGEGASFTGMLSARSRAASFRSPSRGRTVSMGSAVMAAAHAGGSGLPSFSIGAGGWDEQVEAMRRKWAQRQLEHAGIAEPFLALIRESEVKAEELSSAILTVPWLLSELLQSQQTVLGSAVELEPSIAILMLRNGGVFTDHFCAKVDEFIAAASALHRVQQDAFRGCLRRSTPILGQEAAMQRLYLQSFQECEKYRARILACWQQLSWDFDDAALRDKLRQLGSRQRKAFQRLLCLGGGLPPALTDTTPGADPVAKLGDAWAEEVVDEELTFEAIEGPR